MLLLKINRVCIEDVYSSQNHIFVNLAFLSSISTSLTTYAYFFFKIDSVHTWVHNDVEIVLYYRGLVIYI